MSDNDDLFGGWLDEPLPHDFTEDLNVKSGEKLDIFDEMLQADLGNKDFYSKLNPELQKQFSPLVAMRWLSSVPDSSKHRDYTLVLTNEVMNKNFWVLSKDHPELLWKLMAVCGSGQKLRHGWIPMAQRKKISKLGEYMLQWYPGVNDQELSILTDNLTRDEFEQFANSTGCTNEELKAALEAFDADRGTKPAKASKKRKA